MTQPAEPNSTLTIRRRHFEHSDTAWHDVLERDSGDISYVETFWLPQLGPTSVLLLRRTAHLLADSDEVTVPRSFLSASLGVSLATGPNSVFGRTITRLERFGLAYMPPGDNVLHVLTQVPRLTQRQVERLPDPLPVLHQQYIAGQSTVGPEDTMSNPSQVQIRRPLPRSSLQSPQVMVPDSPAALAHHERTLP